MVAGTEVTPPPVTLPQGWLRIGAFVAVPVVDENVSIVPVNEPPPLPGVPYQPTVLPPRPCGAAVSCNVHMTCFIGVSHLAAQMVPMLVLSPRPLWRQANVPCVA